MRKLPSTSPSQYAPVTVPSVFTFEMNVRMALSILQWLYVAGKDPADES